MGCLANVFGFISHTCYRPQTQLPSTSKDKEMRLKRSLVRRTASTAGPFLFLQNGLNPPVPLLKKRISQNNTWFDKVGEEKLKKHLRELLTVRWTTNNRDKRRIWDLSSLSLKLPEKMPRETSLPSTCSFTSIKGRFAVTALRAPFQKNARNMKTTVLWNPHN